MQCHLPPLNLPPEYTLSNDTFRSGLASATVRSISGNSTANIYFGFSLDGVTKYQNISKSLPNINFTLVPITVTFDCAARQLSPIVVNGDGKPIGITVSFVIDRLCIRMRDVKTLLCYSLLCTLKESASV